MNHFTAPHQPGQGEKSGSDPDFRHGPPQDL